MQEGFERVPIVLHELGSVGPVMGVEVLLMQVGLKVEIVRA